MYIADMSNLVALRANASKSFAAKFTKLAQRNRRSISQELLIAAEKHLADETDAPSRKEGPK